MFVPKNKKKKQTKTASTKGWGRQPLGHGTRSTEGDGPVRGPRAQSPVIPFTAPKKPAKKK